MFDESTIERLADHLLSCAAHLEQEQEKNPPAPAPILPSHTDNQEEPVDPIHKMRKLARQLEVIGFNALLLQDILEEYDIQCGSLEEPLEEMPLHINDDDVVSTTIARWRLENNV